MFRCFSRTRQTTSWTLNFFQLIYIVFCVLSNKHPQTHHLFIFSTYTTSLNWNLFSFHGWRQWTWISERWKMKKNKTVYQWKIADYCPFPYIHLASGYVSYEWGRRRRTDWMKEKSHSTIHSFEFSSAVFLCLTHTHPPT